MDIYEDLAICSSKKKNGAVIRGSKPHDKGCTVTPPTNLGSVPQNRDYGDLSIS